MTTMWRLAWALPLVLAVGVAAMLVIRGLVAPSQVKRPAQRLSARGSLSLSDKTCVHLIDVDGKDYLVIESAQQTVLQSVTTAPGDRSRSPVRFGSPWVRRLYGVEPR